MKNKKKVIIAITAMLITFIAIGVVVGIVLSRRKSDDSVVPPSPTPDDNDDNPVVIFSCTAHPSECDGVPTSVSSYITTNYTQPD